MGMGLAKLLSTQAMKISPKFREGSRLKFKKLAYKLKKINATKKKNMRILSINKLVVQTFSIKRK